MINGGLLLQAHVDTSALTSTSDLKYLSKLKIPPVRMSRFDKAEQATSPELDRLGVYREGNRARSNLPSPVDLVRERCRAGKYGRLASPLNCSYAKSKQKLTEPPRRRHRDTTTLQTRSGTAPYARAPRSIPASSFRLRYRRSNESGTKSPSGNGSRLIRLSYLAGGSVGFTPARTVCQCVVSIAERRRPDKHRVVCSTAATRL